jgi:hypothetical protein
MKCRYVRKPRRLVKDEYGRHNVTEQVNTALHSFNIRHTHMSTPVDLYKGKNIVAATKRLTTTWDGIADWSFNYADVAQELKQYMASNGTTMMCFYEAYATEMMSLNFVSTYAILCRFATVK